MSAALFPLKLLLLAIDLFITLITFGWVKALKKLLAPTPLRSVPLKDDPAHRVNAEFKDKLYAGKHSSLYELAKESIEKYADNRAMGSREFLGMESPKVKKFGGVKWRSYQQLGNESYKFGAALRANGLVAAPDTTTLDKISTPCSLAIFENTSPEWMISALGAFSQSIIVTTIYATLGMDAVIDAVNEGIVSAIVCNKTNVGPIVSRISEMKTLKTIIYTSDLVAPDAKIDLPAAPAGVKIVAFDDFVESGEPSKFNPTPPKPDTCAVLMYTSGSTGKPKGVIVKHRNLVACVGAVVSRIGITNTDVYLGYLPLAHILELAAEFGCVFAGCTICYADPKSLTATGATPIGALEQFSPTIMAGVPKIWDVIKKGIEAKISKSPSIVQFLAKTAFEARQFAVEHGYDTPLFNKLVFKKFKGAVGGRLRVALSGGGPLNSEVQVFVRTAFGMPIFQGYGLTETCAGLTIQDPEDLRAGIAGVPIPSVEVKLESTPEICDKAGVAYMSTDTKDVEGNPVYGRGEVLVRGNSVSLGYYMMPDKTKEVYREDGFFETGDIGQFMEDGSLRIVDRKKNLVKLKGGEYIAIEMMEMTYGNSKFVDAIGGGICCYGDGDMDRPIAMMQLNEPIAMAWAKENGVSGDFEAVKNSKELMEAIMTDLKNEHKKGGLSHLEKLVAVSLLTEPWTPENGCLTAANKLQRRVVIEKFAKEFEEVKKKGVF
mmetsp:Transcript_8278/g.11398  ORF Transcript_8278/g.11398 Transcript_8278/m.11398 type:complete len:716 (-) Transcript_8278:97-2244(-)|eukprot:CAMPEP_0185729380 /NCGR_PEP_ID=MMETSP1171-20130828/5539_1 /TAXON_ID=374046 /ORGANISM="Helicotheca tamensis, Strain CCMP826" /LENGTH=715 /DNA_ID=CAMNT_0028398203 /DNA_START=42 /DNA_END=2189 /DNA_ORIENTATION=+